MAAHQGLLVNAPNPPSGFGAMPADVNTRPVLAVRF